mmetsp:Transcript_36518/g.56105  ORF Transcript_36518/g.56105 Transcript_36518/m.56105 type:complete len:141 (+) Transcript_36518:2-424(+)
MGELHGEELSSTYSSADVFVLPSDSETLGFVIMEAMASGIPCVGVKAGGVPNMIDDGVTSFLVPVGDTDAMTERLNRLRDDEFRTTMANKATKVVQEWGWEKSMSLLRNVQYTEALENFQQRREGNMFGWFTKIVKRKYF